MHSGFSCDCQDTAQRRQRHDGRECFIGIDPCLLGESSGYVTCLTSDNVSFSICLCLETSFSTDNVSSLWLPKKDPRLILNQCYIFFRHCFTPNLFCKCLLHPAGPHRSPPFLSSDCVIRSRAPFLFRIDFRNTEFGDLTESVPPLPLPILMHCRCICRWSTPCFVIVSGADRCAWLSS